jgi:pyruvate kinase
MRPRRPIIAVTSSERTWRRTSLMWGVTPVLLRGPRSMPGMVKATRERLICDGLVHTGAPVVAVFGDDVGAEGATTVKVVHID